MTAAHGPSTVAAVLVAGGSGQRLGAPVPKAFCEIGDDTLLGLAAQRFLSHRRVGAVIVVAPATHLDDAHTILRDQERFGDELDARFVAAGLDAFGTPATPTSTRVVAGGDTRQASVRAGLAALDPGIEVVLVHDVARPFVHRRVISAVIAAVREGADAAVPVVPVHDTIRRITSAGEFAGVIERSELVAVQTPQAFRHDVLLAAHAAGERLQVTDDAALVEAMGGRVVPVPGSDELFKITRPWDLVVADALSETGSLDV